MAATGVFFSLASAPTEVAFLRPEGGAAEDGVAGGFGDIGVCGAGAAENGSEDEGEVGESPDVAAAEAEAATSGY